MPASVSIDGPNKTGLPVKSIWLQGDGKGCNSGRRRVRGGYGTLQALAKRPASLVSLPAGHGGSRSLEEGVSVLGAIYRCGPMPRSPRRDLSRAKSWGPAKPRLRLCPALCWSLGVVPRPQSLLPSAGREASLGGDPDRKCRHTSWLWVEPLRQRGSDRRLVLPLVPASPLGR